MLYEAKVTRFSLVGAAGMDMIDHEKGTTTPQQVGHEISTEYSSILIDNHSGFKFDGEDIRRRYLEAPQAKRRRHRIELHGRQAALAAMPGTAGR